MHHLARFLRVVDSSALAMGGEKFPSVGEIADSGHVLMLIACIGRKPVVISADFVEEVEISSRT